MNNFFDIEYDASGLVRSVKQKEIWNKQKMKYSREHEVIIGVFGVGNLVRTKVPSGWIVERFRGKHIAGSSICFVPDPRHEWILEDQ
jgi:hypothetical protein